MIVSIDEAKEYARIEYDEDNTLVSLLVQVAEENLYNATGIRFGSDNALAKLYCLVVIKDLYDNRELTTDKTSDKARYTMQCILTQLKYCYQG